MRPRLTGRGVGLAVGGACGVALGIGVGAVDLAQISAVALLLVVGAFVVTALRDPGRGRHRLRVHRSVSPSPVHAGSQAQVSVEVVADDLTGRVRLGGLRIGEQASAELSGGRPLRARVVRTHRSVGLTYPVHPSRRGRWELGPLMVTLKDPFGVVRSSTALGGQAVIAVWPAVTELPTPRGFLVSEPDRVSLGARSPSTDDSALREYQLGDDLRRVHWRSSARRGELVVRSDERAGTRPVTVLLDLPSQLDALDWTISLGASMALAMLDAGHPVRLLGPPSPPGSDTADGVHARPGHAARTELLDRMIDVQSPAASDAEDQLLTAVRLHLGSSNGNEVVLAIVGPLSAPTRSALGQLATGAEGWAMVRTDPEWSVNDRHEAERTVSHLRKLGWRVCAVQPGDDLRDSWSRMLGARS